jgi:predicted nucleic acid-binding protein
LKKLIDTSAWIEMLKASGVGQSVRKAVPEVENWVVPTIVQLELEKWALRNLSDQEAAKLLSFSNYCVVIQLSTDVAVYAAQLSIDHKLSTADAIIYATAQMNHAELLTCDAHFKDLPSVIYLEK